jgi:hypothetical protein
MRGPAAQAYDAPRVEFEFPSGQSSAVTFDEWDGGISNDLTVRYLVTSGQPAFRYRLAARADTGPVVGPWMSSESTHLMADFEDLAT